MRTAVPLLGATLVFGLLACAPAPAPLPPLALPDSAQAWFDHSTRLLLEATTVQWTTELTPGKVEDSIFQSAFAEPERWAFRVKGAGLASWRQDGGPEHRYQAPTLRILLPDRVEERGFGDGEGHCLLHSLLKGGLVAWRLVHVCFGFESFKVEGFSRERLDGRDAVVLRQEFRLDSPGSANPGCSGIRLWLDATTGLPLRREFSFSSTHGAAPKVFRAVETYSGWKLNEPIPDDDFKP